MPQATLRGRTLLVRFNLPKTLETAHPGLTLQPSPALTDLLPARTSVLELQRFTCSKGRASLTLMPHSRVTSNSRNASASRLKPRPSTSPTPHTLTVPTRAAAAMLAPPYPAVAQCQMEDRSAWSIRQTAWLGKDLMRGSSKSA